MVKPSVNSEKRIDIIGIPQNHQNVTANSPNATPIVIEVTNKSEK